MPRKAKADVRPVRQRTQYTCMSTSMMMCLRALGHDVAEDEVNKVIGARPMQGASWEQALACAQHYGMRATLTMPSTVAQLKEWTDRGVPVMIAWNPEGRPWSHASVVFDVDDQGNVHVADPNIPDPDETVRVVPKSEFYKKWSEKWPDYLVRRPACAIEREITPDGKQIPPRAVKQAFRKMAAEAWVGQKLACGNGPCQCGGDCGCKSRAMGDLERMAGYKGNPDNNDIYPHEVDHGYGEPVAGGTDVMRKLQNQLLHEQGNTEWMRSESPKHARSFSDMPSKAGGTNMDKLAELEALAGCGCDSKKSMDSEPVLGMDEDGMPSYHDHRLHMLERMAGSRRPYVWVKFRDPKYNYGTSMGPTVDEAEARAYFVGQRVNVGVFPEERMERVVDIEFTPAGRNAATRSATVETFLFILTGLLTRYDQRIARQELKRSGRKNIYRLGLLLEAKDKAQGRLRPDILKSDSPEALQELVNALAMEFSMSGDRFDLPPLRQLMTRINNWRDKGKLPKYSSAAPRTKRDVMTLLRRHGLTPEPTPNGPSFEIQGRGTNWAVEVRDSALINQIGEILNVDGFATGYGGFIYRPGYQGKGDWNDPSSAHHYATKADDNKTSDWEPGEREEDSHQEPEGSDVPGVGDDKRASTFNLYGVVKGQELVAAAEAVQVAIQRAMQDGGDVVKLRNVPEHVAAQLVDLGTPASRLAGATALRMARQYMGKTAHDLEAAYFGTREAAGGAYGFPKRLQADCDAASRRIAKQAARIAKSIYAKDARVAEFWATHGERANSLPARVLGAALSDMVPRTASGDIDSAKIAALQAKRDLVAGRTAGGPFTGKGWDAHRKWLGEVQHAQPETVTPSRAKQIIQQAKGRSSYGSWSDQLSRVMTQGEYRYVKDFQRTRSEHSSFLDALGALARGKKAAKYGLYGYRARTSKLGLQGCSDLRQESGRIASDLHRRRSAKHSRIADYLKTHCKEAGCRYSQLLMDSYPAADRKMAAAPTPETVSDWISWED